VQCGAATGAHASLRDLRSLRTLAALSFVHLSPSLCPWVHFGEHMQSLNQFSTMTFPEPVWQVFRFDHHCYWMGACIGARNLRWFMAFVFTQGLTYVYGALYMLLALWTTYSRAMAGDDIILRFLVIELGDHHMRTATLSALIYKCADILMLLLIATGASAWLIDMFVKKAREICDNRSTSAPNRLRVSSSPYLLSLHLLNYVLCRDAPPTLSCAS
jgi:hypothetical protein